MTDIESKVVIVFGAGASYGSGGMKRRPPLGDDLFEILSHEYPQTWGSIPHEYAKRFSPHFEDGMDDYHTHAKDTKDRLFVSLLKDMGRFFAGFGIDRFENNQYYKLVSKYEKRLLAREMLLVTLNYDCLLDIAIRRRGHTVAYPGSVSGVKILKIHGGCNLLLRTNGLVVKGDFIVTDGKFDFPIEVVPPEQVSDELDKRLAPPAMSLYARSKKVIFGPSAVDGMLKEFQSAIRDAGLAVIIGVKPNPSDGHIWGHLSKMKGRLAFVGNRQRYIEWASISRSGNDDIWLDDRFISGFSSICEEIRRVL